MRVLVVTESCFPAGGPTAKAVLDRLVDTGHEVRLLAPAPGLSGYRGCTVVRISPLATPGAQVRAAIDAARPDVVVTLDPGTGPASLGRRALKHCRARGIATTVVQASVVPEVLADYWRTTIAERADLLLATSHFLARRLSAPGLEVEVWAPGVDTLAFTPALRDDWLHRHWSRASSRPEPLVVVGYVGALRKRHGVRRLAAVSRVPGVRLVAIGDGAQRDWLAQHARDPKLTGALGTGDLTVAMATLDVLVHPDEHQTCAHALREAAASGVPVVAPRAGAAVEVVRHLETGLLHEPGSERDLVRAVGALAADRQRALLGVRGRELAEQRPWTVAVDELRTRLERQVRVPSLSGR